MRTSWLFFSYLLFSLKKKKRQPLSRKGMSCRHRASHSSVLPLQESWCSRGSQKSWNPVLTTNELHPCKKSRTLWGINLPTCKPNGGELNTPAGSPVTNSDSSLINRTWVPCLVPRLLYPEGYKRPATCDSESHGCKGKKKISLFLLSVLANHYTDRFREI